MKLEIHAGERIFIELEGTDGVFTISYDYNNSGHLTVEADLPDTGGRRGVIYDEHFNPPIDPAQKVDLSMCAACFIEEQGSTPGSVEHTCGLPNGT